MAAQERPPITDSPWFWVLVFALMALGALAAISGKYGRRQATIERQYQARERVAEQLAENEPGDATRTEDGVTRREYATPENTLLPLWPLAAVLIVVALVAAAMLYRGRGRPGSLNNENPP